MSEYYTQAVVLAHSPRNDKDRYITLYTKDIGKVRVLAKSIRKITSKLAGHLRVGAVANARIIDTGSFQIIDALSIKTPPRDSSLYNFLKFIDQTTPHNEVDHRLWYTIKEIVEGEKISPSIYRYLIEMMGFAPADKIVCGKCKKGGDKVAYFYPPDIIFLCSNCLSLAGTIRDDFVQII